jgi:hypothetical protein
MKKVLTVAPATSLADSTLVLYQHYAVSAYSITSNLNSTQLSATLVQRKLHFRRPGCASPAKASRFYKVSVQHNQRNCSMVTIGLAHALWAKGGRN